jgi:hypothetical protein
MVYSILTRLMASFTIIMALTFDLVQGQIYQNQLMSAVYKSIERVKDVSETYHLGKFKN